MLPGMRNGAGSVVVGVFAECVGAIQRGALIRRVSRSDKEFHFQDWFRQRLDDLDLRFDPPARNTYPDFRMVTVAEGFELKGLAYPGRDATFDSNSQVPTGRHNGRDIWYVFGRYPKDPDGDEYPVIDLVVCHGDFLNADHDYTHKNRHVRGFGSYGDILIRDRKMYVVPTPFRLIDGAAHQRTLVMPAECEPGDGFLEVGQLTRREAADIVVGYTFDLRANDLTSETIPNPNAGREHRFRAWRTAGSATAPVAMRTVTAAQVEAEAEESGDD
jgi:hypothetical protein